MAVTEPADLQVFYDLRNLQQLVVDDNSDPSLVDITVHATILEHLKAAESKVRGHLARNGRYTDADIQRIVDEDGDDLAWFKQIVSRFAMHSLLLRRPRIDAAALDAHETLIKSLIKALQDGEALIGADDEALESGRAGVDGPTVSESLNNNWWRDRSQYFPHRVHPRGRNK